MTVGEVKLIGIDGNWVLDGVIGIGLGILFIVMFSSSSISMGIPAPFYIQSMGVVVNLIAGAIVVMVLAPVFEEAFMSFVLYVTRSIPGMALPLALIIAAFVFAILHWKVYGESMFGAYIGAFLFRMVASPVMIWTNSIVSTGVMHAMVNGYLFLESQQLLSVGGA